LAARKMGIEARELAEARATINQTQGDVVIMFGGELSPAAQTLVAQTPHGFDGNGPRILLHPLPLFNNSVGAHDMVGPNARSAAELLNDGSIRAMILAGTPVLPNGGGDANEVKPNSEFVVLFEHVITAVSEYARVVFPAASYAEVDGTFTNNDGFVQRVRKSIEPVHQSMADWMIVARLAKEFGIDFGFERSASAVFREIAERVPSYSGLRYPLLKDESNPVQVKHEVAPPRDLSNEVDQLRRKIEAMSDSGQKINETPRVGHELFKLGTLTEKVPQFRLLAAGNPTPETFAISPLYQITFDKDLKRETVSA